MFHQHFIIFMPAFSSLISVSRPRRETFIKFFWLAFIRFGLFIWSTLHNIVQRMFSECQHKRVKINYDRVKVGRNHKNENITVDAKSICHGALLKYVLNRINIFKENVNTLRFLPNFQSGRLRTNMNQLEP